MIITPIEPTPALEAFQRARLTRRIATEILRPDTQPDAISKISKNLRDAGMSEKTISTVVKRAIEAARRTRAVVPPTTIDSGGIL